MGAVRLAAWWHGAAGLLLWLGSAGAFFLFIRVSGAGRSGVVILAGLSWWRLAGG